MSTDSDGDGLPDTDEVAAGLNPLLADSDGNGTLDINEDSDHDGLVNLQEFLAGTSPIDLDTDEDSLPDGWEIVQGFMPLQPDSPFAGLPAFDPGRLISGILLADRALRYGPARSAQFKAGDPVTFEDDFVSHGVLAGQQDPIYRVDASGTTERVFLLSGSPARFQNKILAEAILAAGVSQTLPLGRLRPAIAGANFKPETETNCHANYEWRLFHDRGIGLVE